MDNTKHPQPSSLSPLQSYITKQLVSINQLLTELQIDPITLAELEAFNALFSQIFFNSIRQNYLHRMTNLILASPSRYSFKRISNSQKHNRIILIVIITLLLMRNSAQSQIQFNMLFGLIGKLYSEDQLLKEDVFNYFVIFIRIGYVDFEEQLCCNKKMLMNNVMHLLTQLVIRDNLRNKRELLVEALDYFKREIIDQEKDLFLLSKSMAYFNFSCLMQKCIDRFEQKDIRESIVAKLNDMVIPIYQDKFSNELMKTNIDLIKGCIHNYNSKSKEEVIEDLLASGFQMSYLISCSLYEQSKEESDPYQSQRGFIFQGNSIKGFKANINTQLKNFTIIFSFKFIPSSLPIKQSYPLVSFISSEKNALSVFAFSIHQREGKFYFTISTEQEQNKLIDDLVILPYHSYLMTIIGYPSSNICKIKIKCNSLRVSLTVNKIKDKTTLCYIGYKPQVKNESPMVNNSPVFQGEIGTVIILKDILSDQILFNIVNLKGGYDFLFFVSNYETHHLKKYLNIITFNDKFYQMALNCFQSQGQNIMGIITFIFSPLTYQLAYSDKGDLDYLNKSHYKFNYLNINPNELNFQEKTELLSQFSDEFTIFERNSTMFELLKRDGFKFITLHLEYYCSLFVNKNIPLAELKELLLFDRVTNIEKVTSFVFHLFNRILITEYIQELQSFIHLISVLLLKIYNDAENTSPSSLNSETFNHLIKMIVILKPAIQDCALENVRDSLKQLQLTLLSLILNYQFYNTNDLLPNDYLFATVIDIMQDQEQKSFCLNLSFFQKILLFSKIFEVKIDGAKYSIKQNYKTIITNFFAIKKNIFHLLVSLVNYIIVNKDNIAGICVLTKMLFCFEDQNIIKQLCTSFDLSDYFNDILVNEALSEKHFNLLFQLLLSNKKYLETMDMLQFKKYPCALMIKNLLMSLYNHMPNKEKLKKLKGKEVEFDTVAFDKMNNEVFFIIMKSCSVLLNQMNSWSDKSKEIKLTDKDDLYLTYLLMTNFIIKQLNINNSSVLYVYLFHEKENLCRLLFLTAIQLNIPCDQALLEITKSVIFNHKYPFIFPFLKLLVTENQLPDLLMQLHNCISQQLCDSFTSDDPYLLSNMINHLLFIDFISKKQPQLYYSTSNNSSAHFSFIIQHLKKSSLLYSEVFLMTHTSDEPKTLMEIVFDLCVSYYHHTKQKGFLDETLEFFVDTKTKSTKIKSRTIIMTMDYKYDSAIRLMIESVNLELVKLFPQKTCKSKYSDVKFSMYFLIKIILLILKTQHEDSELCAMYEKIAIALCKDISFLIDKNEIREQIDYMPEYQELLNKYYLFYKRNGSYENMKSTFLSYFSSEAMKDFEVSLFKDMTVVHMKNRESLKKSIEESLTSNSHGTGFIEDEYCFKPQHNSTLEIETKEKELELMHNIKLKSPNKTLIQTAFGLYFKDVLFYNEEFIKMKQYYIATFKVNPSTKLLNYPSQRKNFSDTFKPNLFLKQNKHFFTNSYFKVTHRYYTEQSPYIKPHYYTLQKRPIRIEQPKYSCPCELITADHSHFGKLKTAKDFISFESDNNIPIDYHENSEYTFSSMISDRLKNSNKVVIILYSEICEVIVRRYILMGQAIEFYRKDGKSFFFNLFNSEEKKKLIEELKTHLLLPLIIEDCLNEFKKRKFTDKWASSTLSSYEYLLQVNKFASRTFNDINQYVVFPWVLVNYSILDNEQLMEYRLFDRPISFQKKTESQCNPNQSVDKAFEKYIGGHFSTGPFVEYFMMRPTPYLYQLIRFQGMKMEVPDRAFLSFDSILKDIFTSTDNRELIPELYALCEPYINFNCIQIGKTQKGILIDDLLLTHLKENEPLTLASYVNFAMTQSLILNSELVAKNLPVWLDYYFGVKQILLKDKFHICSKYSYEAKAMLDVRREKHRSNNVPADISLGKINEKIQLIFTLGQTPCQVIQSSHPNYKKKATKKATFIDITSMLASPGRQNEIVYFTSSKKNLLLCAMSISRELTIYQLSDLKKVKSIRCKKFKLLKKGYYNSSSFSCKELKGDNAFIPYSFYIFCPKYAYAMLGSKLVLTCRYLDRSFKVQNMKSGLLKEILLDSFVNCICKVNANVVLTGLKTGRLIEWKVNYDASLLVVEKEDLSVTPIRSIIAHEAGINVIVVSKSLNVIATAGNDDLIFIRKLYDFELLTAIKIECELIVVEIVISQYNLLYALCFNVYNQSFCIKGFTLTGLCFATSGYELYNHYEAMDNGTIIVGFYDKNTLAYLDGSTLKKKNDVSLPMKKDNYYKFLTFKYIPDIQKHYLFYSSFNKRDIKK